MSIKIYIDQGHNPVNPNAGAEGNGLREQDLVYTSGKNWPRFCGRTAILMCVFPDRHATPNSARATRRVLRHG